MSPDSVFSRTSGLAGIQYAGLAGVSRSCFRAIKRIVQYGESIEQVRILSSGGTHCFLLTLEFDELVAVKSGFSSGYPGEGPRTFAEALNLLRVFVTDTDIEEYEVTPALLDRLDASALTTNDLEAIEKTPPVRPSRWYDYIYDAGQAGKGGNNILQSLRAVIPWPVIDPRITDLALNFNEAPDTCILTGYRRLEDLLRERLKSDQHGVKLFSQAFQGEKSLLMWKELDAGEQAGRAQLFTGAFLAYRNPRAHKEQKTNDDEMLRELLLLNQLYVLESTAIERPMEEGSSSDSGNPSRIGSCR